jgi:putative PEP-CTERM system histidine kinase
MFNIPTILSLLLFASFVTDFICKNKQRCLPLAIIRLLIGIPLLIYQYYYSHLFPYLTDFHSILRGEILLALLMLHTVNKFNQFVREENPLKNRQENCIFWLLLIIGFTFSFAGKTSFDTLGNPLAIPSCGSMFWVSITVLGAIIFIATRLEEFWKSLENKQRRQFHFFMVGMLLVCATFAWLCSYRLTYRMVIAVHLQFVSTLLLTSWLLMLYAVIRHQLLLRRIYVSRKIVYATAAPLIFSVYLLGLGLITLAMRLSGWSMPFILTSLLIAAGPITLIALALSTKFRNNVKYFINTHFYENKYEYRDEWLAFSEKLQGKMGTREVVDSLTGVLSKALYTDTIMIWLAEGKNNKLSLSFPHEHSNKEAIKPPDSLRDWLKDHPYFYLARSQTEDNWPQIAAECKKFCAEHGLILFSAMTAGNQFAGIIGLGEEVTGGKYGEDDFDLLRALGTQAASALKAAQTAELTARFREQSAWNTMSTFVLHDVKNAQAMLSLARENAPAHIDNPEFQQDLLETIGDALKRMSKVQQRLTILQGRINPAWREINLTDYVERICAKLAKKLDKIKLDFIGQQNIQLKTDPDIIYTILENLYLNSIDYIRIGFQLNILLADEVKFDFI